MAQLGSRSMRDGNVLEPGGTERRILPLEGRDIAITRDDRRLLAGVSLVIDGPGVTVLMGPNGAGKSLLLRVLANLAQPDLGMVRWAGSAPGRDRATKLGFVFQKPVMLRRSVLANVRYGLRAAGFNRRAATERAREALANAGLGHLAGAYARVLSGGEQQRLALVRALAVEPEIMFLDEPTSNLDPASTAAIEQLLLDAVAKTKAVLVTHDLGQAKRLADEVIFLHQGHVTEQTAAEHFFAEPASREARDYLAGKIVL